MKLKEKLQSIPDTPGIYLFYNKQKKLIYVGKATSLKSRVKSYFAKQKTGRPIEQFIHEVNNIKWQITDSVLEAIILEANFIKKYQPKYNVIGKDDKSWNYLAITKDEFPKLITIRQKEFEFKKNKNLDKIFGPFPSLNTKEALKLLRKLFYFSTCKPKSRACFYHQLQQCLGVCTGEIKAQEYKQKVIRPLSLFLAGKKKQVFNILTRQMNLSAKNEDFEEAVRIRNQISNLQRIHDIALLNKNFVQDENSNLIKNSLIKKIEGYDISNLGSTGKVGSLVVFINGLPEKSHYRKFKIKTVVGQSDVHCLAEVLERRLKHLEWPLPDLFLIDGGLPQVNTVKKVLKKFNINLPIIGIAKGPQRKKNEFYLTDKKLADWLKINKNVLIQVRDEAHRFAIKYQRQLRKIKF